MALETSHHDSLDEAFHKTPEQAIMTVIQQHDSFDANDDLEYISDRPECMDATARDVHKFDFDGDNPDTDVTTMVIRQNHQGEWVRVRIKDILLKVDYYGEDERSTRVKFRASLVIPEGRLDEYDYLPRQAHLWRGERVSTDPIDRPAAGD